MNLTSCRVDLVDLSNAEIDGISYNFHDIQRDSESIDVWDGEDFCDSLKGCK
jgi:hypothetical protein